MNLQEEYKVIHYASFRYDGENYLAAGAVKDYLPVFVERSPRRYSRHGKTRWPSWAKFMHGEVDNYEEGSVSDLVELERRYGAITSPVRTLHVDDRRQSRWTDNPFQPPNASPELLEWYAKRDEAVRIWRETGDDTMAIEIGLFPSREEEEELEEMAEAQAQISALRKLEADPCLAQLGETLVEFDALAVLGVSRREEAHSNVLAWLLDPKGNHMLGDFFLAEFLCAIDPCMAEQIRNSDWANTEVQREWHCVVDGKPGSLDILVLNEDTEFACAIENKLLSGEHSNQLRRYRKALEAAYLGFNVSHVFLTRRGNHARLVKEQKFWQPIDHGLVLRLVEVTLEHGPMPANGEVVAFLRQYQKTLRRRIVPETEMRRIANDLYRRHREAIDLIVNQKEAHLRDLRKICKGAIELHEDWQPIGEKSRGKLIGFIDASWEAFSSFHTGKGWADHSDCLTVLMFDLRVEGQLTVILAFEQGTEQCARKSLYDKTKGQHPGIFNQKGKKGEYQEDGSIRLYTSEPILSECDIFDGDRPDWQEKLEKWVSAFVENEYPEMNRIILASLEDMEATREAR